MCEVSNMAVVCSYLVLSFSVMLLRYILNDFEMVSVTIIVGIILFLHSTCTVFLL